MAYKTVFFFLAYFLSLTQELHVRLAFCQFLKKLNSLKKYFPEKSLLFPR